MNLKYVVLYETADDVLETAPIHFPAHAERLQRFHADGRALMAGAFGDPERDGSMAIFSSREAAEEFISDDPFVKNGVVRRYEIREWNEGLVP